MAGSYAISQGELIQHKATSGEMALDAEALGIAPGKLIAALRDLWDLEKEYALRKAAVLKDSLGAGVADSRLFRGGRSVPRCYLFRPRSG